mgnify:CR=1 FL=1
MALGVCAEGLIRLFAVFLAFSFRHIGWGITILLVLWLWFYFFGKMGMGFLSSAAILLVTFLVFFFGAAYMTGAPLCEFANEVSLLLV